MAEALRPGDPARLGPYDLTGRLGEGGQGVVYEGRDSTGRRVAVKLLRAQFTGEPAVRARFVRELEAAERVAGFCTAQVLDADAEGDQPYIVSELVSGPSLHQQVREQGPHVGGDLQRLAVGTATALAAIHQAGIVHRDFKPHNVLLGPDGPRVIDFGIARALDSGGTMTSSVVGTPAFMAPEQISGAQVGPAADVFAWGTTILFAATGYSPFGTDTIPAVMHRVLHADPDLSPLPQPLAGLVAACLSKHPAQRPTAAQLLFSLLGQQGNGPAAMGPALEHGATVAMGQTAPPVHAFPAPGPYALRPPERSRSEGVPVLALAAVVFAVLTAELSQTWSPVSFSPNVWAGSLYAAMLAAVLLPAARLADAIGRKTVFLVGLGFYAMAAVIAGAVGVALNSSFVYQIPGQVLMGIGAGLFLAPALAILRDMFPGRGFELAVGLTAAVAGAPYALGALIAQPLQDAPFGVSYFAAIPLAVIAAVLGAAGMRESKQRGGSSRAGVPVILLAGGLLFALTIGLRLGLRYGWDDLGALLSLLAVAVLLGALMIVHALMRPRLFSTAQAAAVLLGALALAAAYMVNDSVLYLLLADHGGTGYELALRRAPILPAALVGGVAGGALAVRIGGRAVLAAGSALAGVACLGLALVGGAADSYLVLLPWLVLFGLTVGAIIAAVGIILVGPERDGLAGVASGLQQVTLMLAPLLLIALVSSRKDSQMFHRSAEVVMSNHRPSLLIAGAVALAACGLAFLIHRPPAPEPGHPVAAPPR